MFNENTINIKFELEFNQQDIIRILSIWSNYCDISNLMCFLTWA